MVCVCMPSAFDRLHKSNFEWCEKCAIKKICNRDSIYGVTYINCNKYEFLCTSFIPRCCECKFCDTSHPTNNAVGICKIFNNVVYESDFCNRGEPK